MLIWPGPVKSIVPRGDISYQKKRTYKSAGYMEKQGDQTGVSSTGFKRKKCRKHQVHDDNHLWMAGSH